MNETLILLAAFIAALLSLLAALALFDCIRFDDGIGEPALTAKPEPRRVRAGPVRAATQEEIVTTTREAHKAAAQQLMTGVAAVNPYPRGHARHAPFAIGVAERLVQAEEHRCYGSHTF